MSENGFLIVDASEPPAEKVNEELPPAPPNMDPFGCDTAG